jgi:hypothetical protein
MCVLPQAGEPRLISGSGARLSGREPSVAERHGPG